MVLTRASRRVRIGAFASAAVLGLGVIVTGTAFADENRPTQEELIRECAGEVAVLEGVSTRCEFEKQEDLGSYRRWEPLGEAQSNCTGSDLTVPVTVGGSRTRTETWEVKGEIKLELGGGLGIGGGGGFSVANAVQVTRSFQIPTKPGEKVIGTVGYHTEKFKGKWNVETMTVGGAEDTPQHDWYTIENIELHRPSGHVEYGHDQKKCNEKLIGEPGGPAFYIT